MGWPAACACATRRRTQLPGVPEEPSGVGPAMLTSQLTQSLRVHMPKVSPDGGQPNLIGPPLIRSSFVD